MLSFALGIPLPQVLLGLYVRRDMLLPMISRLTVAGTHLARQGSCTPPHTVHRFDLTLQSRTQQLGLRGDHRGPTHPADLHAPPLAHHPRPGGTAALRAFNNQSKSQLCCDADTQLKGSGVHRSLALRVVLYFVAAILGILVYQVRLTADPCKVLMKDGRLRRVLLHH